MCPTPAFHRSFPAVTPLENAVGSVNLRETYAALASPRVRNNAVADFTITASFRARREAPVVHARDDDRADLRRRGGMVRRTPGALWPVRQRVFLSHDPEQYGRRAATSVRGECAGHVPPCLPPSRPALAGHAAAVSFGGPALSRTLGTDYAKSAAMSFATRLRLPVVSSDGCWPASECGEEAAWHRSVRVRRYWSRA
jgi:hypothetical protein